MSAHFSALTLSDHDYPFSEKERSELWAHIVRSYDCDIVLDPQFHIRALEAQNIKFTNFQKNAEAEAANCDKLISQTRSIVASLKELTAKYDNVAQETHQFQTSAQKLIDDHNSLMLVYNEIKANLLQFESLDEITKTLNNPNGGNLVKKRSFRDTLLKLDECLLFVEANLDYKEVELYQVRFRQCMTRALTIIRSYILQEFKGVETEISQRIKDISVKDKSLNNVTIDAFLYTKFGERATSYAELLAEISKRVEKHPEYTGLLQECVDQYIRIRFNLLHPIMWDHLDHSIVKQKTLVQFAQDNISFFTTLINKEFDLFLKFFLEEAVPGLLVLHAHEINLFSQWVTAKLCEPLYDTLRNKIIRESSINSLCEMATLLLKYYEFEEGVDMYEFLPSQSADKLDFGEFFKPILEDVQSRLVFRVQWFVDEKILKYKPKFEDLKIARSNLIAAGDDESLLPPAEGKGFNDLYPPLSQSIQLLSQIYQLVNSSIFDDLAHYIVHSCMIVLKTGAYELALKTLGPIDSQLYLMANYLILQKLISQFEIEVIRTETTIDFTGFSNIMNYVTRRGSSTNTNDKNFLELAKDSVPKVVKNMIDARMELTIELRTLVDDFTKTFVANKIMYAIQGDVNLATSVEQIHKLRDNIDIELPNLRNAMVLFIHDTQVIDFLVDGIQEAIVSQYEVYYNDLVHLYSTPGSNLEPRPNLDDVMELDTLMGFLGEVVGKMYRSRQSSLATADMLPDDDSLYNVSD
ncbi:hypothetical protein BABINDRAFT_29730 [Babjeviella inositovora NRRL Y-12698]|uniref:Conserved oligomeric Golgi complex subunit 3 n=1 Tax=Babjeviella inositovora NRRL Y-12698 TaxID=984486 RepID=A0A1E3QZ44_9ASCO|nr:uncharacterized protein BABINDRAFT_29730 [Babjeviella inositovora NRRL Y-12698]ODQ82357.1 hypothetical protein BABINDRAFT_29730 [Babjeviella inositovora NRRL Y-12698]